MTRPKRNNRGVKGQLVMVWGSNCHYCKKSFAFDDLTVDHKVPESRGGGHYFTNLCLACGPCNEDKRDMTEEEYARYLGMSEVQKQRFLTKLWLWRITRLEAERKAAIAYHLRAPKKEVMTYEIGERWPENDRGSKMGDQEGPTETEEDNG